MKSLTKIEQKKLFKESKRFELEVEEDYYLSNCILPPTVLLNTEIYPEISTK